VLRRVTVAARTAVSSSAAGSLRAGVVFAVASFAAPVTAPGRVERTGAAARPFFAFFLPPRAMIFALLLPPSAIWTHKEVKDWEGFFPTRKEISQWFEPDERTLLPRALACKAGVY
jgi:hypothetical protein